MVKKILHLIASPRGEDSHSRRLANYFLNKLTESHPDYQVEEVELFAAKLPEFSSAGATAKFKANRDILMTAEEQHQWAAAKEYCTNFKAADAFVFSLPMWNFSIPYQLKHYLDLITQPRWLFNVSETGYCGLMNGKKALLVYSSGGYYNTPETAQFDFQSSYMSAWASFIGLEVYEATVHSTDIEAKHDKIEEESKAQLDNILRAFCI